MKLTNRQYEILKGGIVGGCASLLFFMFQSIQILLIFAVVLGLISAIIAGYRKDKKMPKQEREKCLSLKQLIWGNNHND